MNSTEIKALIEKCIGSESSLAEEKQLLDIFTSGDYPPEFETEASIFRYLMWEASERKRNPEFERELKLRENSIPVTLPRHRKFRRTTTWLAVATVLLLGGLTFTFRHIISKPQVPEYSVFRDPKTGYAVSRKEMQKAMVNLNKLYGASRQIERINKNKTICSYLSVFQKVKPVNNNTNEKGSIN